MYLYIYVFLYIHFIQLKKYTDFILPIRDI